MKALTASTVVTAVADLTQAVEGGRNARFARTRLTLLFEGMRDRMGAAQAACAILDDAKASGKLGVQITGQKTVTIVVEGIETTTTKDVRNDTTSNAKSLLASCVNAAYKGHADRLSIKSEKVGASSPVWKAVTAVDKVESLLASLIDELELTSPEAESLRHSVNRMSAAKATAKQEAAELAKLEAEKLEAEKLEAAAKREAERLDAITAKVSDILTSQGLKAGSANWKAAEQALLVAFN